MRPAPRDDTVKDIHQIAERYGIGRHGISIPIRELGVGDAMFSINFDCDDRHWGEVRRELVNEVHLFAHYYHQRVKKLIAAQQRPMGEGFELSPREREVLMWAAEGKTACGNRRDPEAQHQRCKPLRRARHEQAAGPHQDPGRGHRGAELDVQLILPS